MSSGHTTPTFPNPVVQPETVTPKIDTTYNDLEADLELLSSDGITFLIMKFHLQSASPIFRQTLLLPFTPSPTSTEPPNATAESTSPGARCKIELSDPSFETAKTVRHFLQLLDGSWFPAFNAVLDSDLLSSLFAFADKWECKLVITSLTHALLGMATNNQSHKCAVWRTFALAARRGETGVCADILRNVSGPAGTWPHNHPKVENGQARAGYWVLDPTGMTIPMMEAIPPLYLWALTRVFHDLRIKEGDEREEWLKTEWSEKRHRPSCKGCECKLLGPAGSEADDEEHEASSPDWTAMADQFTKLIVRYKGSMKLGGGCVMGS